MMAERNFRNRTFFHGDNLEFLRGMNSATVNLIATDPPFKKQRGFFSEAGGFKDTWTWQRDAQGLDLAGNAVAENHEEWLENARKDLPKVVAAVENARIASGDDMGAFLCWMAPRMLEMHRLLTPDGSLYLHCDHTAAAYLKVLLDAIFGKQNFRNEIVWAYPASPSAARRDFPRKHDTLLRYAKGNEWVFNADAVSVPYADSSIERIKYPANASTVMEGSEIVLRQSGKIPPSTWSDIQQSYRYRAEHTGYPTQKPLALYERIIKASSNPGDLVLDPFCGCATTCVAAERLGRQWVGMDIAEIAHDLILQRLQDSRQLLADGVPEVHYETAAPERTDAGNTAAPDLALRRPAPRADWQKLTRAQMTQAMRRAQQAGVQTGGLLVGADGLVVCAGCGRELEPEFMHLDHRDPKSAGGEDYITNRILLCQPCNGKKTNRLALPGLWRANKRDGWMRDETKAKVVMDRAIETGRRVRDEWGAQWVQDLLTV